MKAIIQKEYGPVGVLSTGDVDRPVPQDNEVLVRVHSAGLDRGTVHLMKGEPYIVRLAGYGIRAPKNPIPGLDVAGTVESVGSGVTRFEVGDQVFGIGQGSFADYTAALEDKLASKPPSLSFDEAAAVPVSGLTAIQGVRDVGKVQPGQSVLVVGASGGVGSFAVQIAKSYGATVTGVCSTGKVDMVRSLGADQVVDYTSEDFADGSSRYDVIIDIGGNTALSRLRRALTDKGTLVIVGGEEGGRWIGGIDRQLRAVALSPFTRQRLTTFISKETDVDLEALGELLDAGELRPQVGGIYPLERVPDAVRDLEAGQARGKLVIAVHSEAPQP